MAAYDDFVDLIRQTETMQALLRNLESEPAKILAAVCREHEMTGKDVPDHHLNLAGYFGEAMLRALLSADLVARVPGDRCALYGYRPTKQGLKLYQAMRKEKTI